MDSSQIYTQIHRKGGDTIVRISLGSTLPSTAQWILIIGLIIGALGIATQTFVLTAMQSSIVLFVVGVLTLLLKVLTTEPA